MTYNPIKSNFQTFSTVSYLSFFFSYYGKSTVIDYDVLAQIHDVYSYLTLFNIYNYRIILYHTIDNIILIINFTLQVNTLSHERFIQHIK